MKKNTWTESLNKYMENDNFLEFENLDLRSKKNIKNYISYIEDISAGMSRQELFEKYIPESFKFYSLIEEDRPIKISEHSYVVSSEAKLQPLAYLRLLYDIKDGINNKSLLKFTIRITGTLFDSHENNLIGEQAYLLNAFFSKKLSEIKREEAVKPPSKYSVVENILNKLDFSVHTKDEILERIRQKFLELNISFSDRSIVGIWERIPGGLVLYSRGTFLNVDMSVFTDAVMNEIGNELKDIINKLDVISASLMATKIFDALPDNIPKSVATMLTSEMALHSFLKRNFNIDRIIYKRMPIIVVDKGYETIDSYISDVVKKYVYTEMEVDELRNILKDAHGFNEEYARNWISILSRGDQSILKIEEGKVVKIYE